MAFLLGRPQAKSQLKHQTLRLFFNNTYLKDQINLITISFLTLISDTLLGEFLFWRTSSNKDIKFHLIEIDDTSDNYRLSPEYHILSSKKVGIVGIGSAG